MSDIYTDDRSVGSDEPPEATSQIKDIALLTTNLPETVESDTQAVLLFLAAENAVRQAKLLMESVKSLNKAYMVKAGIYSIEMTDTAKLILSKKKTDRFDTEYIYKQLAFTDEQIAVLPKNPSWRKTAVFANDKISCAHSIEEKDEWEIKVFDEKFLK